MYRIVNIKFLFDLADLKNLDSALLKLCQLISPKCSFFKVARWFDFTNFIKEKKIHSNMLLYTEVSCTLVF